MNYVALLNTNGTVDASFHPGTSVDDWIWSAAVQPDGKVLIGGYLTSVSGVSRNGIARLNVDGTLDTSFNPGVGADGAVISLAPLADGKVILGGWFTSMSGVARNGIARLNSDGRLDTTFDPLTYVGDTVESIGLQPDGRVFLGGWIFGSSVVRLNYDGTTDNSFTLGAGDGAPWSIAFQPDGKAVIGGAFSLVNGYNRSGVARLPTDSQVKRPRLFGTTVSAGSYATRFVGVPWSSHTLQTSSNAVDWIDRQTNFCNPNRVSQFLDNSQTQSARFYRLKVGGP